MTREVSSTPTEGDLTRDSSSGDESGTDEETEKDKQKRIPDWARGPLLKDALERQYGLNGHTAVDPDQIFYEVQTCSLEEIFGVREGRSGAYAKRTSSARWDLDSLSLVEKRTAQFAGEWQTAEPTAARQSIYAKLLTRHRLPK